MIKYVKMNPSGFVVSKLQGTKLLSLKKNKPIHTDTFMFNI